MQSAFLFEWHIQGLREIVIVGNSKERDALGKNGTLDAARTIVSGFDKISVIECIGEMSIKAHQVNFATTKLKYPAEKTWIYVMDVDTRFTPQTFEELLHRVEQGYPIIQQHTHFLRGFDQLGVLGKLFAAYQSRWTLVHEIARIWLYNKTFIGMYHLVGHGLCINLTKFKALGGFSEDVKVEDVHLGYVCTILGEKVFSCCQLEASDTPDDLIQLWWQQYGWSLGALHFPIYYKKLKRDGFKFTFYIRTCNICSRYGIILGGFPIAP